MTDKTLATAKVPRTPSPEPPAYARSTTTLVADIEKEGLEEEQAPPSPHLCPDGHDTRPHPALLGFALAACPCTLIYLAARRTVTCRRCKDRVAKKGCLPFGSKYARTEVVKPRVV